MAIITNWSGTPAQPLQPPAQQWYLIDIPVNLSVSVSGDDGETITGCVMSSNVNLVFTDGVDSGSASGTVDLESFSDITVTHVSKGSSDLLEVPITETLSIVPDNREIYDINITELPDITVSVTATISYSTLLGGPQVIAANYNFDARFDYSSTKTWIQNYLANRY